ncbi:MAG: alpha-glucan phosphorylase [Chloroflexi bacterium]|nr:MAG: alpha-glucan phosphorylase [Chloroflexota bacterium]
MKPIQTFTVVPAVPPALERLRDVAYNLRWSWNPEAIALFRRMDNDLWESTHHNPVAMLGAIEQRRLNELAADDGFQAHLERVAQDLDAYLADTHTWFERIHDGVHQPLVGYFSAEFGLTDCLSIFAGGLGLLAGDHLKAASDLGVPIVGVGLLYQKGYFRQTLNDAGWQQEVYDVNDFHTLPLTLVTDASGAELRVVAPHPGRDVLARIWQVRVGRVNLYLLDTNLDENWPEDRDITDQLYGGDQEMRIRQEIVLGIGGCRALDALNLDPAVYHLNEGHSAFLALERARMLMERNGLTFDEAKEVAAGGLVFTSHTPVPAGHDTFPGWLVERYLKDYAYELGLTMDQFLAFGRRNPADQNEPYGMTPLALRFATVTNGVSKLHGDVTRKMWQGLWPNVPLDETPIDHITNGVHLRTWVSPELDSCYERYLGPRWRDEPTDETIWTQLGHIPDEELWRTHERRRESLITFTRRRLQAQLIKRGAPRSDIDFAGEVLDPEVLTIGFARRFATYKRATLLMRDPERLERILNHPERPVQFIFAGKAHPRDDAGKELIRQVVQATRQERFRRRIIFLENYDTAVARFLVQGCDVWLNNPRRPMEASGTSGMKAAANGVLNISTLDGWWDEMWASHATAAVPIGWAIGRGEIYDDDGYQDAVEAEALYELLEREVVPLFYDRGQDHIPRQWISRMQASIAATAPFANAQRMVREYTERFYLPTAQHALHLRSDNVAAGKALAAWKTRVAAVWGDVRVEASDATPTGELAVGTTLHATALVNLGELTPDDVAVELYSGKIDARGEFIDPQIDRMRPVNWDGGPRCTFEADASPARTSGLHGYTIRVRPDHPDLRPRFIPGLITWADASAVPVASGR